MKQLFPKEENFLQKKFYLIKEIFHKKESLLQNFFPYSRRFSINKEVFHKQKFSWINKFFYKDFSTVKKIFCKQRSNIFYKSKILNPFNTKSDAKIFFNPLTLVGNKILYALKQTSSNNMCELLSLNIKK